ncbi:insulin-like growth factor-binding protein 2-B [Salvelinus alpinus]
MLTQSRPGTQPHSRASGQEWDCPCSPAGPIVELQGAEGPPQKKPTKDASPWMWSKQKAVRQAQNELKTKMKTNTRPEEPRTQRHTQSHCQQEMDKVLEEISKMTFHDNREPLENLYELNFPNCDRRGQYNLKQLLQRLQLFVMGSIKNTKHEK